MVTKEKRACVLESQKTKSSNYTCIWLQIMGLLRAQFLYLQTGMGAARAHKIVSLNENM